MAAYTCPMCRGPVRAKSRGNFAGILPGLILICAGVALTFFVPCFGWVAGPLLCLFALTMDGKRIWKCGNCGWWAPR